MEQPITIHHMHCGKVKLDANMIYPNHLDSASFGLSSTLLEREDLIWLPNSAFLIEHPKGRILFDTGWNTDVRFGEPGYNKLPPSIINRAFLPKGQSIIEQLSTLGLTAKDLDIVILSHLHSDHIAGLQQLHDLKSILICDRERADRHLRTEIRYYHKYLYNFEPNDLCTYFHFPEYSEEFQIPIWDLFGDGTILICDTPGHTSGTVSLIIRSAKEFVLLYSDVGCGQRSWKYEQVSRNSLRPDRAKESIAWVKKLSLMDHCKTSIAGHDPDKLPEIIQI